MTNRTDHPETERKEIRSMLRLMRGNYEWALYEGGEYQYWQKVNSLKEKLDLLTRIPESATERAPLTLQNLHDSWEWDTREERKMLVRTMRFSSGSWIDFVLTLNGAIGSANKVQKLRLTT